jgi:hypothetical protein
MAVNPTPSVGVSRARNTVVASRARQALRVIPVLRIFSVEKAREYYLDYAGFHLDWEHRDGPNAPLYMQVFRDGLVL